LRQFNGCTKGKRRNACKANGTDTASECDMGLGAQRDCEECCHQTERCDVAKIMDGDCRPKIDVRARSTENDNSDYYARAQRCPTPRFSCAARSGKHHFTLLDLGVASLGPCVDSIVGSIVGY
jgi:hypothetical protein